MKTKVVSRKMVTNQVFVVVSSTVTSDDAYSEPDVVGVFKNKKALVAGVDRTLFQWDDPKYVIDRAEFDKLPDNWWNVIKVHANIGGYLVQQYTISQHIIEQAPYKS